MARSRRRPKATPSDLPGTDQGLLLLSYSKIFEDLGVGASLIGAILWRPIHGALEVMSFEMVHERMGDRYAYNGRCMSQAIREQVTVVGEHRGLHDFFVPIPGRPDAMLVVGPYATAWPTAADIHERWRSLTGRQGHPADPDFSRYLTSRLSGLVLDGTSALDLQRLLERLAKLGVGQGDTVDLETELQALHERLMQKRQTDRVWDAAARMVDERTSRLWASVFRKDQLPTIGLKHFPEHVAVGLLVSRKELDPVEDLVRRYAFQRACVELAQAHGDTISGQLGDHGVTFLASSRGSTSRAKARLTELAQRAALLARRRFDLAVRFGVSTLSMPLPRQFGAALAAAETAFSSDTSLIHAERGGRRASALHTLRQELSSMLEVDPKGLPARFDRFLDAVAMRTAHRPEPARVHLETAFERLTEVLLQSGALEPRGHDALQSALERRAREAATLSELFSAYRVAVGELVRAVERPRLALRERNLRRAEVYLSQHYAEPVTLAEAAHTAGFAPGYFSKLFSKKHGTTFEQYVRQLRLRRARELLVDTTLGLQRIAQLSGFSRATYLSRVFKQTHHETPMAYRQRARNSPLRKLRSAKRPPKRSR